MGIHRLRRSHQNEKWSCFPKSRTFGSRSCNESRRCKGKSLCQRKRYQEWYDDAQELIDDPEVNAIYIATPPSSHATYAIMAMKAGKPAYIEKPMAQTYEECTRINRISQETGIPCFVAYYRRYLPYFQK